MPAPPIPNQGAPIAVVLVDPVTGTAYSNAAGSGGSYLAASAPLASNNDFTPAGFVTAAPPVGRLDVTQGAGVATTLTGLIAGKDGQQLVIFNADPANSLTLSKENAGSAAANRFTASADTAIAAQASKLLMYTAGTINRWRVIG